MIPQIPTLQRALVVRDINILPKVERVPTPEVLNGTALLRNLACPVISYAKQIFLGNARNYPYPLPIVPGFSAICRIAALPPDSTSLEVGQLVYFDCFVRARDAQSGPVQFLSAISEGHTPPSKKLMREAGVKDGTYAEYARVYLENVFVIDERRFLGSPEDGGLNLKIEELCEIAKLLVPFGGMRSVKSQPGETVLVSPATGAFGGAACMIALAMGARVIAWGRNEAKLANLKTVLERIKGEKYRGMIETAKLWNEPGKDMEAVRKAAKGKSVDIFFDISPPEAKGTTHIETGILNLKHGGRVSLMGGLREQVSIPHFFVMRFDITLQGKWMYERDDVFALLKMIDAGILTLGKSGGCQVTGKFGLEEWKDAWDLAEAKAGLAETAVITP